MFTSQSFCLAHNTKLDKYKNVCQTKSGTLLCAVFCYLCNKCNYEKTRGTKCNAKLHIWLPTPKSIDIQDARAQRHRGTEKRTDKAEHVGLFDCKSLIFACSGGQTPFKHEKTTIIRFLLVLWKLRHKSCHSREVKKSPFYANLSSDQKLDKSYAILLLVCSKVSGQIVQIPQFSMFSSSNPTMYFSECNYPKTR